MKINSSGRVGGIETEVSQQPAAVSTRWRLEQSEAVRRWQTKTRSLSRGDELAGLLGAEPSDFRMIGTEDGIRLLKETMADVERLLDHDPETRGTVLLLLEEEILRWNDVQMRLDPGAQE